MDYNFRASHNDIQIFKAFIFNATPCSQNPNRIEEITDFKILQSEYQLRNIRKK